MTNSDEVLVRQARLQFQAVADMLASFSSDIQALVTGDEIQPERRAKLRTAVRQARRRIVLFVRFVPGVYIIDGRRLDSDLLGMHAAWLAFRSPGSGPLVAELGKPGAKDPARVVRGALKRAAELLKGYDPALAAEVASMGTKAGRVRYDLRASRLVDVAAGAPKVLSRSASA